MVACMTQRASRFPSVLFSWVLNFGSHDCLEVGVLQHPDTMLWTGKGYQGMDRSARRDGQNNGIHALL